jgi:hypothetical protein
VVLEAASGGSGKTKVGGAVGINYSSELDKRSQDFAVA